MVEWRWWRRRHRIYVHDHNPFSISIRKPYIYSKSYVANEANSSVVYMLCIDFICVRYPLLFSAPRVYYTYNIYFYKPDREIHLGFAYIHFPMLKLCVIFSFLFSFSLSPSSFHRLVLSLWFLFHLLALITIARRNIRQRRRRRRTARAHTHTRYIETDSGHTPQYTQTIC